MFILLYLNIAGAFATELERSILVQIWHVGWDAARCGDPSPVAFLQPACQVYGCP